MAYITLANTRKIISNTGLDNPTIKGEIYKIPIYFFSKYEENELLAIQELLKNPENFFKTFYKKQKAIDTYKYIYEGKSPAYHDDRDCPRLNSRFLNYEIPVQIREQSQEKVIEFRKWFNEVKHLLNKPDIFVERLRLRWGIVTNPKSIDYDNSGIDEIENKSIGDMENEINVLIKEAGRFYYREEKNTTILKKFSKYTYLAYKAQPINNNDTGFSDLELKELLKEYDSKFKKPLKKLLIEYYKLKLNPEIVMDKTILQAIGFIPCGHCVDSQNTDRTNTAKNQADYYPKSILFDYDDDDLPF